MTMLAPSPVPTISPDDLLSMDGLFELVDGHLVEKKMSFLSGATSVKLSSVLQAYIAQHRSGTLASEATFRCFPNNSEQVRRPDLAFITASRLDQVPEQGHVRIAPDLAIEIVSPNDSVYDLDDKMQDYRSAGIPMIWIVNPHARTVKVFRPGKHIDELSQADQLTGADVLPGFSILVSELFPPRDK